MGVSGKPGSSPAKTRVLLHQNREKRCRQQANRSVSLYILQACEWATNHHRTACVEPGSVEAGSWVRDSSADMRTNQTLECGRPSRATRSPRPLVELESPPCKDMCPKRHQRVGMGHNINRVFYHLSFEASIISGFPYGLTDGCRTERVDVLHVWEMISVRLQYCVISGICVKLFGTLFVPMHWATIPHTTLAIGHEKTNAQLFLPHHTTCRLGRPPIFF